MKRNTTKCHLLISSGEEMNLSILTSQIENSSFEWLLGTDIDRKMSFENHINQICTKGKTKIKALANTIPFLNKGKIKLLIHAFFKSQFSYCSLSWMYSSTKLINKLNSLHGRCLRLSTHNLQKTIKQRKPHACSCPLCRTYIYQVDFK